MALNPTSVYGIGYDNDPSNQQVQPNPGVLPAKKLQMLGQANNKVTANVANQQVGTALLSSSGGTILANTFNSVTVTNTLVTASSIIFLTAVNNTANGAFATDTTAARGMDVWVESVASGSFVVGYNPRANMAADWSVNYLVFN